VDIDILSLDIASDTYEYNVHFIGKVALRITTANANFVTRTVKIPQGRLMFSFDSLVIMITVEFSDH
jgi:hypothetical protein